MKEVSENPVHVAVEVVCILFIIYMWRQKPFIPDRRPPGEEPTAKEKEDMIAEWCSRKFTVAPEGTEDDAAPVEVVEEVTSDGFVKFEGKAEKCYDCAGFNYLHLAADERVVKASLEAVDHFGVGSCGPRGFYGTVQPHLVLEEQLKTIYGTSDAIVYSFQYNTCAAIIPAFSAAKDVLVVDSGVNSGIMAGVGLSRSVVHYYKHGDMDDLERVLREVDEKQKKTGKPPTRRWIVTEGVFRNHGTVAKLARIVELKQQYKFRVVLDDSFATGVLGRSGLGTSEECGVSPLDCDVLVGSMDAALGSIGGFCVGSARVVDHQRLSSSAYCFSASLPPFSAVAATTSFNIIQSSPSLVEAVRLCGEAMRSVLGAAFPHLLTTFADSKNSPIIHITFPPNTTATADEQATLLEQARKELQEKHHIAVARPVYPKGEKFPTPHSLRVTVSAGKSVAIMKERAEAIAAVAKKYIM